MAGVARSAEDAAAFVTLFAAAAEDPVLSVTEVATIVAEFTVIDADGNAPVDDDWESTYDLMGATASAWRVKAGKAASRYTFQTGAMRESESDLKTHCDQMAATYERYGNHSILVAGQVGKHFDETAAINIGHVWEDE